MGILHDTTTPAVLDYVTIGHAVPQALKIQDRLRIIDELSELWERVFTMHFPQRQNFTKTLICTASNPGGKMRILHDTTTPAVIDFTEELLTG